ncbi:MAG: hypothetical protein AB7P37_21090 [Ramlibacter sp.]
MMPNCNICKKPVQPGQAYNGATKNHWDCDPRRSIEEIKADMDRSLKKAREALNALDHLSASVRRQRRRT